MSSSTESLVKVLDTVIESKIKTTENITIMSVLLYKAGSNLVAINLGKLSY